MALKPLLGNTDYNSVTMQHYARIHMVNKFRGSRSHTIRELLSSWPHVSRNMWYALLARNNPVVGRSETRYAALKLVKRLSSLPLGRYSSSTMQLGLGQTV